jgi:uncharacterized OsmC-like protein
MRNGISAAGLSELANEIKQHPTQAHAAYGVNVKWLSGTRSHATALPMHVGDQTVNRDFQWFIDEPKQLGGSNHAPNPQEYLLSGFGSCMMVAYLVGASIMGIQLAQLDIEVRSELDLAGFLGVHPDAPVPLKGITYVVRVSGGGTAEQFESLRETAQAHSPNAMSLATAVTVSGSVQVL